MSLLIVLPSENEILERRRASHVEEGELVMHAVDADVFGYLSKRTDWSTGTVGLQSAVSHGRIALDLSENIPRKSARNMRVVNNKAVQDSITRMVRVGLFERYSTSELDVGRNRLVLSRIFWREMLAEQHFAKNPDVTQTLGFITEFSKNKSINNSGLNGFCDGQNYARSSADVTNNTIYISNADTHKFRMTLSWQPDRDFVNQFLSVSGFSGDQIERVWFGKYVQYWCKQDVLRTQQGWTEHFANHMQGYLIDQGRFDRLNGVGVTPTLIRNAGSQPKRLTVPNIPDGSRLQDWATSNGLESCPVGYDTRQYYQLLCNQVERINNANDDKGDRVLQ